VKLCQILFGMFRFQRTPAAQIDGGATEYVLQQFQPFPAYDVINARGQHYRKQLSAYSPGLVALNPAGTPFDVTQIPEGELDIFISGGEGGLES
jgi:hypothetical protein